MKKSGLFAIIVGFVLIFSITSCSNGTTDNADLLGSTSGLPAFVSTNQSDEYFYELSYESTSSARAAVLIPKEDGKYSLIVYGVNDG